MYLIEVTKEELYDYIGPKNFSCVIIGTKFPYTTVFKNKINGDIEAKIEPDGKCIGITSDPYKHFILR